MPILYFWLVLIIGAYLLGLSVLFVIWAVSETNFLEKIIQRMTLGIILLAAIAEILMFASQF